MAAKEDNKTNGCTFQWKIENISFCFLKAGERIESPAFVVDALERTSWSLLLYPMGFSDNNRVYLYLQRKGLPENITVNYQVSLMSKDGSFLTYEQSCFPKDRNRGIVSIILREKVFVTDREKFIPDDTVQCTIWREHDESPVDPNHLSARTIFNVNRRAFECRIDKISTLKTGIKNTFQDELVNFDLIVNKSIQREKRLDIKIISFLGNLKYFQFKIAVVNSDGEEEILGDTHVVEYLEKDLKPGMLSPLVLIEKLLENKSQYSPHDSLLLNCEYTSSNGAFVHEVYNYGIISPKLKKVVFERRNRHCVEKENAVNTPVLVNDLKSMYNDGIFSDTELRTSTQNFPVHKNILSARSPVFRKMFTHDMKEKNSGHVDITDLEDDTVHRMLLFIYTNYLGDLQLDDACKLYAAADKYDILSLKSSCSSFLKNNICPIKACEVLALADRHQDDVLKNFVQDFILKNDKEVFGSQEWKNFMATNIYLAADIMYRKVFPG